MTDEELRVSWNRLAARPYGRMSRMSPPADAPRYGPFAPDEDALRLLGDLQDRRALELGCGGGQNAIALARRGATCLGVDLSDAQIDYARALADQEGVSGRVQFAQGEMIAFLEEPAISLAGAFDLVFCVNALQYVGDLPRCFQGVCRALRPGGLFVFALDHPLSVITVWDADARQALLRASYFDRMRHAWNWDDPDLTPPLPMISYYRTLGDIVDALADSGLLVSRLLEPEPTDEFAADLTPNDAELFARVPATLILRALRP